MNLLEVASKYAPNSPLLFSIVKELLHYDILETLYENPISKFLVFQGGTALRLCYNNNRYSEDLDFVINDGFEFKLSDMDFFKESFQKRIVLKYGLDIELDEPKNDDSLVKKYTAKVLLALTNEQKSKINIEIAQIPSYQNSFRIINNNYPNDFSVNTLIRVESKEEILADKIIALATRVHMKFRDLWDIKFLSDSNILLDMDLVRAKINDYRIENFVDKLEAKIVLMEEQDLEQDFLAEMSRFLEPKLFEFTQNNAFYKDIQKEVLNMAKKTLNDLKNLNSHTHKYRKKQ